MSADEERGTTSRDHWTEALTWYVALHEADRGNPDNGPVHEWRDWWADSANRRTFEDLSRLLADRARYRKRQRPGKAELEEDSYDPSVPIAQWRRAQSQDPVRRQRPSPGGWRWWLLGGLGAAATAVLLALLPPRTGSAGGPAGATTYETNVGGIEEVHLRDGSSIVLGGQTKLSVTFSVRRRSVRLIAGEAWFKVAHDRNWPFVVAAGDGTITAVGTAFLVMRDSDRVVVTVTEGTVEVSARPPVWPPFRLVRQFSMRSTSLSIPVSRGEALAFSDKGPLPPVRPADTTAATAWTHGRLMFDDQPLRYVVDTINRYSPRRIVVDPSAGALRFSGTVFDNDIDDWLESLEVILPVTEKEQEGSIYIRMSRSASDSR